MRKIRKGDYVVVLAGKEKGKRGKVLSVLGDDYKVTVESVNMVRKHVRAASRKGMPGRLVEECMPIHISNVGLYNPATNRADKVGFRLLGDGRKVRFFKSTNEVIDT